MQPSNRITIVTDTEGNQPIRVAHRERLIAMSEKLDGYLADFEAQLSALLGSLPAE